jgi:PIN domain nuclease of toxin-antitoxin system
MAVFFKAPAFAQVFSLIEDGGEMIVVSLITAYVFDITSNGGRLRFNVWSWVRSRVQLPG